MKELEQIKKDCLSCRKCGLGVSGKCVFSSMTPSKFFILGQNPGAEEVAQGIPFVGISGKIFNSLLEEVGLKRDMFYITNSIKCFTEGNRPPKSEELLTCRGWLDIEIGTLQPSIIVTLGNFALKQMTGKSGIGTYHGRVMEVGERKIFPLFHPSPLVTNKKEHKDAIINDLIVLKGLMR